MLRSGHSLRLTATEMEELRALGIDVSSVKCAGDFAAALDPWLHALADVRPDLFRKIGDKIAAAKGMQLPPESGPDRQ